jgi:tripartite-type tricarboxylate transporter receptor subunit TctC
VSEEGHQVTSFVRAALTAIVISLGFGGVAAAQSGWPDRPIRMLISFPPGGSSDAIARIVQPGLEKRLGQPLVLENRPGAGGMIAIDAVARAAPDGYTIGLGGAGALGGNVALGEKMTYDPRKDVAPVTVLSGSPFILAAAASFAGKSVPEIIALAKREKIAIGHGGNGTLMHLTAEMFNQMAGTKLPLVPYRGIAPVVTDLIGGHVALGIVDPPSAVAAIEGGKIKAVAISSAARFPRLKDVPTFAEQGLPGFESFGWFGIVAPAKTPSAVVERLNAALVAELQQPSVVERIRALGAEPMPQTPAEFSGFIVREIDKWTKVVAASGGLPK